MGRHLEETGEKPVRLLQACFLVALRYQGDGPNDRGSHVELSLLAQMSCRIAPHKAIPTVYVVQPGHSQIGVFRPRARIICQEECWNMHMGLAQRLQFTWFGSLNVKQAWRTSVNILGVGRDEQNLFSCGARPAAH
jgi:hypothetical protein